MKTVLAAVWFIVLSPMIVDAAPRADVILALDTSGSMDEEQQMAETHLNSFALALTGAGIDARFILIAGREVCIPAPLGSGACPGDQNLERYRHVAVSVQSNDALAKILETHSEWRSSLRPDATKTIIVVSDDESDLSASAFVNRLLALEGSFQGFKFNAVAANADPFIIGNKCFALSANEGRVYKDLVTQTGGIFKDLCEQDLRGAFDEMAAAIRTDLAPRFLRGNCNGDDAVDISDAVCTLEWLFLGREDPGCLAATNVNGDNAIDISDAVRILDFLFLGGPSPVGPFPECGPATLVADQEIGCQTRPGICL